MPYSTYMKLTDERPAETEIRLSLASHLYICPLGIAEDVLVEKAEHVYPMDFVILNIKEDEKRPFILGTPFLTTAKAMIKFDKGTITLRSRKSKISFHRIPEYPGMIERGVKNNIEPIAPEMHNMTWLFEKNRQEYTDLHPDILSKTVLERLEDRTSPF
ncbi:reverse transcriptase domain-containing protein [Tanacetum coccineum]